MKSLRGNRILALALCLCMAVGFMPVVRADVSGIKVQKVNDTDYTKEGAIATVIEVGGTAQVAILLSNPDSSSHEISIVLSASGDVITGVTGGTGISIPAVADTTPGAANVFLSLSVNPEKDSRIYSDQTLWVYFKDVRDPLEVKFKLQKTSLSDAQKAELNAPEEEEEKPVNPNTTLQAALVLDSTGLDGLPVPAPVGDAGDSVRIRLPLWNRNGRTGLYSESRLSGITVTPVISATLDSFPFLIQEVDYTRVLSDMRGGEKQELIYDFVISDKATSGVKEIKFNAVYYNGAKNAFETSTFSAFVTVLKGAKSEEGGVTDAEGNLVTSTPKIIIESYKLTPLPDADAAESEGEDKSRLFAGDTFELAFAVRNTADDEAVENIQIRLEDTNGAILPAEGGSNSLYIDRIASGESVERAIRMQTIPDAEAKSHSLAVSFSYESGETKKAYESTETLTLPVAQRMRIKMDDPVLYETMVMPGSSIGIYFGLYNMGKATLYNCMVDVEGEGLRMEESYFGGNVPAGGSMRADFTIVAETPGEIEGNVLVTYEDVYGEQTVVKKPIRITVMEESAPEMGMESMPMMEDGYYDENGNFIPAGAEGVGGGLPWWAYAGIGAFVLAALIVLLVKLRKRRRQREIEDI